MPIEARNSVASNAEKHMLIETMTEQQLQPKERQVNTGSVNIHILDVRRTGCTYNTTKTYVRWMLRYYEK